MPRKCGTFVGFVLGRLETSLRVSFRMMLSVWRFAVVRMADVKKELEIYCCGNDCGAWKERAGGDRRVRGDSESLQGYRQCVRRKRQAVSARA